EVPREVPQYEIPRGLIEPRAGLSRLRSLGQRQDRFRVPNPAQRHVADIDLGRGHRSPSGSETALGEPRAVLRLQGGLLLALRRRLVAVTDLRRHLGIGLGGLAALAALALRLVLGGLHHPFLREFLLVVDDKGFADTTPAAVVPELGGPYFNRHESPPHTAPG